jgi:ferredoxin
MNVECEIAPHQSVLDVANENKIYIKSVCRGVPSCAECRVRLIEGEHNVFPPAGKELNLIGTAYFVDQRRLSCQVKCYGDIVIDLTEQIEKQQTTVKAPRGISKDQAKGESAAKMGNIILEAVEEKTQEEAVNSRFAEEDKKIRNSEHQYVVDQAKRELEMLKRQRQPQPARPGSPQGPSRSTGHTPKRDDSGDEGGD